MSTDDGLASNRTHKHHLERTVRILLGIIAMPMAEANSLIFRQTFIDSKPGKCQHIDLRSRTTGNALAVHF